MQTGQNNTGSHGQKAESLTSGYPRRVGPIAVEPYVLKGGHRLCKLRIMSLSSILDKTDVDALIAILQEAREAL